MGEASYSGASGEQLTSTIGQHLDSVAANDPNHPALIVPHQNIRWSYAEFVAEVDRFATGMLALGIVQGDRVGIWSPNRYEWVVTQFATAKIGAIWFVLIRLTGCMNWSIRSTKSVARPLSPQRVSRTATT